MQTPDTATWCSCILFLFPLSLFLIHSFSSPWTCPLCRWYCACFHLWSDRTWFIWQAFNPVCACPSASDTKHPRACVSATKSGSLSFSGYNLQPARQQITFISAPLYCIGWEVEWDNTSQISHWSNKLWFFFFPFCPNSYLNYWKHNLCVMISSSENKLFKDMGF